MTKYTENIYTRWKCYGQKKIMTRDTLCEKICNIETCHEP